MAWTNEAVIEFLDLYESDEVIWNPLLENNKDKNVTYDASKIKQISFSFDLSMKGLKKKKDDNLLFCRLLGHIRRELPAAATTLN